MAPPSAPSGGGGLPPLVPARRVAPLGVGPRGARKPLSHIKSAITPNVPPAAWKKKASGANQLPPPHHHTHTGRQAGRQAGRCLTGVGGRVTGGAEWRGRHGAACVGCGKWPLCGCAARPCVRCAVCRLHRQRAKPCVCVASMCVPSFSSPLLMPCVCLRMWLCLRICGCGSFGGGVCACACVSV